MAIFAWCSPLLGVAQTVAAHRAIRVLPDQMTAVSLLDRLCHHAHIITTSGDSYRLRHRTTSRGED